MIWSYFRDKILKCDEMTEGRKHENTDGTSDIGDYVNSSLDVFTFMLDIVILREISFVACASQH